VVAAGVVHLFSVPVPSRPFSRFSLPALAKRVGNVNSGGRHSRRSVRCSLGHENRVGQYFCGECGAALNSRAAICPVGHANPDGQRFCGECGVPIVVPPGVETVSSAGRWSIDPMGSHQYRYWDGAEWSSHVADNGEFATHRFSKPAGRRPEFWFGTVAALVTLLLLAGAAADIWIQLTRDAETKQTTASQSSTPLSPSEVAAASPAPPPPAAPPAEAVAVIATPCHPNSSTSSTGDGSVAYCERLESTDTYLWSLYPGDIPLPEVEDGGDPAMGVCMVQTEQSNDQCDEYLQRPSYPGDAAAPPTRQ
jgi:hypothetical protein